MNKPAFDPNQPFEASKPPFDSNAPFTPGGQDQAQPDSSMLDVAKYAAMAPFKQPFQATREMAQHPENLTGVLPAAGATLGGMAGSAIPVIGTGVGAAAGAGLGQIGKRIADIGLGNVQPGEAMNPKREAIAPMVQAAAAGIPEVSGVFTPGSQTVAQTIQKGFQKAGETLSGLKQDISAQASRQGISSYAALSLPKAQAVFAEALGPEGQAAMKSTASQAFDPALGQARSIATDIGTKIESGETVSALDALKARQATDRVISATPRWDTKARQALFDWRTKFDDIITAQNGPLKNASDVYRQAIVRDKLLTPTRMNKGGEPSALLPMILGAAGPIAGYGSGHTGRGTEAALAGLAATSPAVWGLGAATLGAISPDVRRAALASFIDKITSK